MKRAVGTAAALAALAAVLLARPAAAGPSKKEQLLEDKARARSDGTRAADRRRGESSCAPGGPQAGRHRQHLQHVDPRVLALAADGSESPPPEWSTASALHSTNDKPPWTRPFGVLRAPPALQSPRVECVRLPAPKYNLILRKKGRRVARKSEHTFGNAVDFRLPGVTTERLRTWARRQRLGGVGYYRDDGFVHMDTGSICYWAE